MASIYEETIKHQEEKTKYTENKDQAWEWIKSSIWDILIGLAILIYITTGIFQVVETGRSIWEILATGGLAFLFGFSINILFSKKGLIKAEQHPLVLKTNLEHDEVYQKVLPYISASDDWCNIENAAALRIVREQILAKAAMSYSDHFDENGRLKSVSYDIDKTMSKEQVKRVLEKRETLKKATKSRISYLTISKLISLDTDNLDPHSMGKTKRQYEKGVVTTSSIDRLLPAIIVGYFSIQPVFGLTFGHFVWTALHSIMFIIFGYVKYLNSYYFIVDENRLNTKKKIALLNKFLNWLKEKNINVVEQRENKEQK